MKTLTRSHEAHGKLVEKILQKDMLGKLDLPGVVGHFNVVRHWEELLLTQKGILKNGYELNGYPVIASPDIVFVSENPDYLVFGEVKTHRNASSDRGMGRQLHQCREYADEYAEHLVDFLHDEGIRDKQIDRLTLGFLGIFGRKNSIESAEYHGF